ncbi:MAG: ABC transporter permease [Halobacteriaceae archaeon]
MSSDATDGTNRRWPAWVTRTLGLTRREVLRVVRRPKNTVMPPIVTNALYVTVFGVILGARIGRTQGVPYLQFVLPGLIALGAISQSFQNAAFSLFHSRWEEYVETMVAAPMSNAEEVVSYLFGSAVRGWTVGLAILALGYAFTAVPVRHPGLLLAFLVVVVTLFGGMGIVGGLWAGDFDQLTVFNQFMIRPLVFFGGVFYPLSDLPGIAQSLSYLNPMVYIVNGIRYSLVGISTVPPLTSLAVLVGATALVIAVDLWLFRIGYGITE